MTGKSSYSGAPRATDKVSLVRLAIGDTNSQDWLFTDQEIQVYLDAADQVVTYAASALCLSAAAKVARDIDFASGRTRFNLSQKYKHYMDLHDRLRRGGAGDIIGGDGSGVPNAEMLVGGTSISERDAMLDSDDRIQPSFRMGRDDHPATDDVIEDDDVLRRRYGG